ncbi:MAG TPA: hypothetical protein VGZ01_12935 [Trinickia sp.]|nr:hypothetical protein [Trinickia sp.]
MSMKTTHLLAAALLAPATFVSLRTAAALDVSPNPTVAQSSAAGDSFENSASGPKYTAQIGRVKNGQQWSWSANADAFSKRASLFAASD